MKYVDFCGNKISQFCLGTATYGTRYEMTQSLNYALKNGINYIDTARSYNNGDGESIIGEWSTYVQRDKYYIATKREIKNDIWYPNTVSKFIYEQCEKLNTPYIDYFLLHGLDGLDATNIWIDAICRSDICKSLDQLKKDGVVRKIGFSYYGKGEDLEYLLNRYNWDFVQIRHNIIDDHNFTTIFDTNKLSYDAALEYKKNHPDFGIMIMEPLSSAMLYNLDYNEDIQSQYVGLKWNVDTELPILIGSRTKDQLVQTLKLYYDIINNKYDNIDMDYYINKINNFFDERLPENIRCVNCYRCNECEKKYNIWYIIRIYNELFLRKDSTKLKEYFTRNDMIDCGDCCKCELRCPTVDIKKCLKEIKNYIKQ